MHCNWLAAGYSSEEGYDLLLLRMQTDSGDMEEICDMRLGSNPSFLCPGMNGIYAAEEYDSGASVLLVSVECGRLYIERKIDVEGCFGLCHLAVYGDIVVGCCYGSGHVFAVDAMLTKVLWRRHNTARQRPLSHVHWSIRYDESTLCCADLGLDSLLLRSISDGALQDTIPLEQGSGVRQIVLSTDKKLVYVVNESKSTLDVLALTGIPKLAASVRTTQSNLSNYPGAACLSREGILFVANRGADTIAAFDMNSTEPRFMFETGCGGTWPRWITLSEKEDFMICCNQKSGNVTSLRLSKGSLDVCGSVSLKNASCAVAAS